MSSPADFQVPLSGSETLATARERDLAQGMAADLVFTQDGTGRYLAFCWRDADQYGLDTKQVMGSRIDDVFRPVPSAPFLSRVQRVLDYRTAERFTYSFHHGQHCFLFDLLLSPILALNGIPTAVHVMGQLLSNTLVDAEPSPDNAPAYQGYQVFLPSSDRYQKLLTQITWNIRRTLDLPTIWQQTVDGLGRALGVNRCVICPYEPFSSTVKVVAEYRQEPFRSMMGLELNVVEDPHLSRAIAELRPVWLDSEAATLPSGEAVHSAQRNEPDLEQQAVLVVATCYQDEPNGLLILHQCDRRRAWNDAEIELLQELADQVGTAIAHASLFNESQSLATEVQRVNVNLLQKHRELEEARKQAEEASRLKSEFLANTSHELRTPLNGMIGFLKLIMDGMAEDPVEQAEFIEEAYRSALHLLNIINDVLDIAKIEAGKMQIELSPLKLDELLNDVENFTRSQIQQKQLQFEIHKPPTHDDIIVFGNYQRLLQVMLNLVGNAIKFTHEGGITISAEVLKKKIAVQNQELPATLRIRVADTGIGVSLDKQDKLFQSFSQVDGSRTRQYGGTGLGLAISQRLVEAMGGEVFFYSMGEGLGSTVTFTVPLYQEPVMALEAGDPIDLMI